MGDPSHHNYSDSIHGLCQYYDLAAEGDQKERCREAIDALVASHEGKSLEEIFLSLTAQ